MADKPIKLTPNGRLTKKARREWAMTYYNEDVLKPAIHGDWDLLSEHIEKGFDITDEMRKFLVGVLRGTVKRPNNRPAKRATETRKDSIAIYAATLESQGLSATEATEKAMDKFAADRRTVQRALEQRRRRYTRPRSK
jgi:hypothetical protein